MRCLFLLVISVYYLFLFLFFNYVFNNDVFVDCDILTVSLPSPSPSPCRNHLEWNRKTLLSHRNDRYQEQNFNLKKHEIEINCYDALQIFILSIGVFTFIRLSLLHLCTRVSYVTFNTDLNLYSKKKTLLVSTQ